MNLKAIIREAEKRNASVKRIERGLRVGQTKEVGRRKCTIDYILRFGLSLNVYGIVFADRKKPRSAIVNADAFENVRSARGGK